MDLYKTLMQNSPELQGLLQNNQTTIIIIITH